MIDAVSLETMSRVRTLRYLNLEDNLLVKLPPDLSALRNIEELNLNGNPIGNLREATDSLATIGPNLQSLHIFLYEEE